jgi:hypothetical protein
VASTDFLIHHRLQQQSHLALVFPEIIGDMIGTNGMCYGTKPICENYLECNAGLASLTSSNA